MVTSITKTVSSAISNGGRYSCLKLTFYVDGKELSLLIKMFILFSGDLEAARDGLMKMKYYSNIDDQIRESESWN